jgi:hypothetical protein
MYPNVVADVIYDEAVGAWMRTGLGIPIGILDITDRNRDLQERLGILALLEFYASFRICKLEILSAAQEAYPRLWPPFRQPGP